MERILNINQGCEKHAARQVLDEITVIKTNLKLHNIDNPQRTIMVTSDCASCGKSTVSVLLSEILADKDHKVLLVDCDLRKPSLYRKLGMLPEKGGLVDAILAVKEGGAPEEFIVPSLFPYIDFLSFGQMPRRPGDLLDSRQFSELLELMSAKYRHVILDCSPVRGMADAFLVAQKVDGAIIVARYGTTRIGSFYRMLKDWAPLKDRILGVIINQRTTRYDSYSNYYGYYGYGGGDGGGKGKPEAARRGH